jgi:hypothetical protein
MRRVVRRISQGLSWMLVLAAVVPDVRWCEAAWADLPVECLLASESSASCGAAPIESDDCSSDSSCPIPEPLGCGGGGCPLAPIGERAWCPSSALGAEAVAAQAPTAPTLDVAIGVLPDELSLEIPAPHRGLDDSGIPPPLEHQPRARPPVRAPPQV